MSRLTLLTGTSGSGKTSYLLEKLSTADVDLTSIVGLVCPARFENDVKTGIEAWLLPGSQRFLLAQARNLSATLKSESYGLSWIFNSQALSQVNAHFRSLARATEVEAANSCLIIDEIGPLEFHHNQGFVDGLDLLDKAVFGEALIVVRTSLISAAKARWQNIYDTIEIIELGVGGGI